MDLQNSPNAKKIFREITNKIKVVKFSDGSEWQFFLRRGTQSQVAERIFVGHFLQNLFEPGPSEGTYIRPSFWDNDIQRALEGHIDASLWFLREVFISASADQPQSLHQRLRFFEKLFRDCQNVPCDHFLRKVGDAMLDDVLTDKNNKERIRKMLNTPNRWAKVESIRRTEGYQQLLHEALNSEDPSTALLEMHGYGAKEGYRQNDYTGGWARFAYSCLNPYWLGEKEVTKKFILLIMAKLREKNLKDSPNYLTTLNSYLIPSSDCNTKKLELAIRCERKLFELSSFFTRVEEFTMRRIIRTRRHNKVWQMSDDGGKSWQMYDKDKKSWRMADD